MVHKLKLIAASLASAFLLVAGGAVAAAAPSNNPHNQITLCHATGKSQAHTYIKVTANANGNASGHAGSHHQQGRDIIPPFDYTSKGTTKHFPGQNWNAQGQATFNNNCVPTTPGRGGGLVTGTTVTPGTTAQVKAPAGAVNAGAGGGSTVSAAAVAGIGGSIVSVIGGLLWSYKRKLI